jgi:hypothetical protein
MAKAKTPEKIVNPPAGEVKETDSLVHAPTSSALAKSNMPAWLAAKMADHAPQGLEAAERSDLIYPRLVLCQDLTPQVKDRKADIGDIIDNLTGEILCKAGEKLRIIPIVFNKGRVKFKPIVDGGGSTCRSDDSKKAQSGGDGEDEGGNPTTDCSACIHSKWDDSAEGKDALPACTLLYNTLVLLPDHGGRVVVWSGKSTNLKVIRRFLSACKQTAVDLWALQFSLWSRDDSKGQLSFKQWDFAPEGYVQDPKEYEAGAELFKGLTGKVWAASEEGLETEPDTNGNATDFPPDEGGAEAPAGPRPEMAAAAAALAAKAAAEAKAAPKGKAPPAAAAKPTAADESGF